MTASGGDGNGNSGHRLVGTIFELNVDHALVQALRCRTVSWGV
jgi:hypothetical protein